MSEQLRGWDLTPTERRVAEHAFAAEFQHCGDTGRAARTAASAVGSLRSGTAYSNDPAAVAMLDTLRREPEHSVLALQASVDLFWAVADAAKYDGPRNTTDLSQWFARCHGRHLRDSQTIGRMRDLLERVLSCPDDAPFYVIEDIREELAK